MQAATIILFVQNPVQQYVLHSDVEARPPGHKHVAFCLKPFLTLLVRWTYVGLPFLACALAAVAGRLMRS